MFTIHNMYQGKYTVKRVSTYDNGVFVCTLYDHKLTNLLKSGWSHERIYHPMLIAKLCYQFQWPMILEHSTLLIG